MATISSSGHKCLTVGHCCSERKGTLSEETLPSLLAAEMKVESGCPMAPCIWEGSRVVVCGHVLYGDVRVWEWAVGPERTRGLSVSLLGPLQVLRTKH